MAEKTKSGKSFPLKSFIIRQLILLKFIWKLYRKKPVIILVWHQVSPHFIRGFNNLHDWTSSEDFEKSIQFLLKKKFVFISLTDAHKILASSEKRKHRYVVCTFDDGYTNILDTLPLLEKYNIPATFFINTAYLDGNSVKWTDIQNFIESADENAIIPEEAKVSIEKLSVSGEPENYDYYRKMAENSYPVFRKNNNLYITWEKLFAIDNPLFTIGLHGHEHAHHPYMTPEWGKQNLLENFERLKDHPNFISYISFPFGAYTVEEAEYFEILGFKTLRCNGLVNYEYSNPLNRSEMDGKVVSFRLMVKLSGESVSLRRFLIRKLY